MIVADTSVFIDLFFEYRPDRTQLSEELFRIIKGKPIFEPELFKIELASQIVRRMRREGAITTAEETFKQLNFVALSDIFELAFLIAIETGCRAADSFYIAAAKTTGSILVSSDRAQVESAKKFGINARFISLMEPMF
ncbi:type II toxin-antitoxin system VapC family toxin [Thermococcus sp.]|uniref:type II toxin-antitoxin system VapC family toxin n=1 Tax=Thermococcus sp. TaxID=35749 RepID=UPI002639079C|nr:type II toxin-antitoxin system VapC family toxin [Thermococcus sp.]